MAGIRQRGSSITDPSSNPSLLPPTRTSGFGSHVPPSLGSTARDNYTTAPYLPRNPHSPHSHGYHSIPDIPRSAILPAAMPLSPHSGAQYSAAAMMNYGQVQHDRHETPPFEEQSVLHEIRSEDNSIVNPKIDAKIEKGFFMSADRVWTCYRRNYFSVQSSYTLSPHLPNERLYLHRPNKNVAQIQALAMSLSAAVDGPAGKIIELIQHTPKRDKGPQLPIAKERLLPAPPGKTQEGVHGYPLTSYHNTNPIASPFLPLQQEVDSTSNASVQSSGHSHNSYTHTFERIQFKSATANNGKRRAQQQYYHLIVELWADVRPTGDSKPTWIKVAHRVSAAVVVRGRSPSHYSNEGPSTSGTSRQGGHGGSSAGGHSSYGGGSVGGFRGLNTNLAGLIGGAGGYGYRGGYSVNPSPVNSHCISSASSSSGGVVEGMVSDHAMEDVENKPTENFDGYQYYPSPLYDAGLHGQVKPDYAQNTYDEARKVKDEYNAGFATEWPAGGCGRHIGVESSRGYYPNLQVSPPTY